MEAAAHRKHRFKNITKIGLKMTEKYLEDGVLELVRIKKILTYNENNKIAEFQNISIFLGI
jgi:hypothetical protein